MDLGIKGPGIEMKRRGEAHEVAALIVFSCSQQAGFITGANYRGDGGSVATMRSLPMGEGPADAPGRR